MEEDNIYGHKIFFLNSTYEFKKYVVPALQKAEYETHIIDSYKDTKNILRHHPESFLFILMNGDLSTKGWFNFVKSIENTPDLNKTTIGIIGDTHVKEDDKKMFLTGANIQAGFYTIGIDKIEKIIEDIKGVLELNKAKGRRQYVRATCIQDKEAKMFWTFGGKMHMFQLLDISSVGMAAIIPPSAVPYIKKDAAMGNVSLLIDGRQHSIDIKVFNIAQRQNIIVGVFMINPKVEEPTKDAIRKYISATLFAQIQKTCYSDAKDNTNYNAESGFTSNKKEDNKDKANQQEKKATESEASADNKVDGSENIDKNADDSASSSATVQDNITDEKTNEEEKTSEAQADNTSKDDSTEKAE